jgi:hypothetical protein
MLYQLSYTPEKTWCGKEGGPFSSYDITEARLYMRLVLRSKSGVLSTEGDYSSSKKDYLRKR